MISPALALTKALIAVSLDCNNLYRKYAIFRIFVVQYQIVLPQQDIFKHH